MDAARSQNLKKLLDAVPAGYLVDAAWLVSQGIAYESFRDYVNMRTEIVERHESSYIKRVEAAQRAREKRKKPSE